MKVMKHAGLAAGAMLSCSVVGPASGDIVIGDVLDVVYQGTGATRAVAWTFDGDAGTSSAGLLRWNGGLQSFCVQLEENISSGQSISFEVVAPESLPDQPPLPGPMGGARSIVVQDLFARFHDDVVGRSGDDLRDHAAAFQMVVWEISHEMGADDSNPQSVLAGLSFDSGIATFESGSAVESIAGSMLAGLGVGGFTPDSRLFGLTSDSYQDQLIVVPNAGALAGLGGVLAIRRRRRRG